MAIALLASACPTPVVFSGLPLLQTAENTTGVSGANTLDTYAAGDTSIAAKLNRLLLAVELIGRYGAGAYGICSGLVISTVASLSLPVTAGHALVDGVVEVPANTTYTVPDNTARVYIWLKQDGTITHGTTTSVPTGGKVFLGSCVTSGGQVTSVDTSGVVYLKSGVAWRQTADKGLPSDTPTSVPPGMVTLTVGGSWVWSGTEHQQLVGYHARHPVDVRASITADYTLTTGDANIQRITCAAQRKVMVPPDADLDYGMWFQIINDNGFAGASVLVRDNGDTTTLATVTYGQSVRIGVGISGGSPAISVGTPATFSADA